MKKLASNIDFIKDDRAQIITIDGVRVDYPNGWSSFSQVSVNRVDVTFNGYQSHWSKILSRNMISIQPNSEFILNLA
jgi:hypothetical protein